MSSNKRTGTLLDHFKAKPAAKRARSDSKDGAAAEAATSTSTAANGDNNDNNNSSNNDSNSNGDAAGEEESEAAKPDLVQLYNARPPPGFALDEVRDLLGLEWDSMGTAWLEVLAARYFLTPKFLELKRFLKQQHAAGKTIFPPAADLYSWSRHTDSPADVRVVIMGQDPYHGAGQAHGLCFSVKPGVAIPPSLRNMYKELSTQYPAQFVKPAHGYLVGWATQGVLLLNATLTVESGKANSHSGKGWEQVTTGVVEYLGSADRKSGIVFMLWGGSAKVYKKFIDKKKHLVLECAHPSPLSAAKGWFGNGHFTKANEWLKKNGRKAIDWCNLPIAEPKKDK